MHRFPAYVRRENIGPEMAELSGEERIKALTARMLRKRLFVVLSKGATTADKLAPVLPAHLDYMIDLERQGILFASGPLTDESGAMRGDGLTILRADSLDAAKEIANRDPFVKKKLRTYDLREWTLMEGSFGVTVRFSDQTLDIA